MEEELALARSAGFPRAEGVALRAAGLLAGAEGIAALSESCEVLARSPARLELALSLQLSCRERPVQQKEPPNYRRQSRRRAFCWCVRTGLVLGRSPPYER